MADEQFTNSDLISILFSNNQITMKVMLNTEHQWQVLQDKLKEMSFIDNLELLAKWDYEFVPGPIYGDTTIEFGNTSNGVDPYLYTRFTYFSETIPIDIYVYAPVSGSIVIDNKNPSSIKILSDFFIHTFESVSPSNSYFYADEGSPVAIYHANTDGSDNWVDYSIRTTFFDGKNNVYLNPLDFLSNKPLFAIQYASISDTYYNLQLLKNSGFSLYQMRDYLSAHINASADEYVAKPGGAFY